MELCLAVMAILDLLFQVALVNVFSVTSATVDESFHTQSGGNVNKLQYHVTTSEIHRTR